MVDSKVPLRGNTEKARGGGSSVAVAKEDEGKAFFQQVVLPPSWLFSRQLWLGPQCSKLLLSCCTKFWPLINLNSQYQALMNLM